MEVSNTFKVLRHPERITEWMRTGHTFAPVGFDLHLTNECPHNCPHCNGKRGKTAQLVDTDAMRILDEAHEAGIKAVHFCGGGEPLAHPQAVSIIEYSSVIGLSVGLITNAYRLTVEEARKLAQVCTWIRISLDASCADEYCRMHGATIDQWDTTCANIRLLANAKDRKAAIGVGFLTGKDSGSHIEDMCRVALELGADYAQFRPLSGDYTNFFNELKRNKKELDTSDFTITAAWGKYERMGSRLKEAGKCHGCQFWTLVDASGDMRLCCESDSSKNLIGNVRDHAFTSLWTKHREVIDGFDTARCPDPCRMTENNKLLAEIAEPIYHEPHI